MAHMIQKNARARTHTHTPRDIYCTPAFCWLVGIDPGQKSDTPEIEHGKHQALDKFSPLEEVATTQEKTGPKSRVSHIPHQPQIAPFG